MEDNGNESESITLNRNDCRRNEKDRTKCGNQRCRNERDSRQTAREDRITTPTLEMESNDLGDCSVHDELDVVLYPAGGCFNKLRKKQVFLEHLLRQHWAGYIGSPPLLKREYVKRHILQSIRDSGRTLKIFRGSSLENGTYLIPQEDAAFKLIGQKFRGITKASLMQVQDNGARTAESNYDAKYRTGTECGNQRCRNEGDLHRTVREDRSITPALEMESNDLEGTSSIEEEHDVVFYPVGSCSNKFRKKHVFLEHLLRQHWAGYIASPSFLKRDYVKKHILQSIRDSGRTLKIFRGSSLENGSYCIPDEDEAFKLIGRKFRSITAKNKFSSMVHLVLASDMTRSQIDLVERKRRADVNDLTTLPAVKRTRMCVIDCLEAARYQFSPKNEFVKHYMRNKLEEQEAAGVLRSWELRKAYHREGVQQFAALSYEELKTWERYSRTKIELQPQIRARILREVEQNPTKSNAQLAEAIDQWCCGTVIGDWLLSEGCTSFREQKKKEATRRAGRKNRVPRDRRCVIDNLEAARCQFTPQKEFVKHYADVRKKAQELQREGGSRRALPLTYRKEGEKRFATLSAKERQKWEQHSRAKIERQPQIRTLIRQEVERNPWKTHAQLAEAIDHWCSPTIIGCWLQKHGYAPCLHNIQNDDVTNH
jgi:hypothetical protein